MSSYHFTWNTVSRGKGQSAVHTAAYNSRSQLVDEAGQRLTKDYAYKGDLLFQGVFVPADAPDWAKDRNRLWNEAEAVLRQENGRSARKYEMSLPHELTPQQREWLVKDYVRETFVRRGLAVDVAIHPPDEKGDQRNYHVHLLVTTHRLEADGFAATKRDLRDMETKQALVAMKEKWAHMGANALLKAGYEVEAERFRYGHLTNAHQREAALARGDYEWAAIKELEAQKHKGPVSTAIERRGETNERLDRLQPIMARHNDMRELVEINAALTAERVKVERVLPGVAGDIRLAWSLSDSGASFAAALQDRGLTLAHVTAQEAETSYTLSKFAQALGGYAPRFTEGEMVVVNGFGAAFRLDQRTTGEGRAEVDKYLGPVDRSILPTLTEARGIEAQEAMRETSREQFMNRQLAERPAIKIETAINQLLADSHEFGYFAGAAYYNGIAIAQVSRGDLANLQKEAAAHRHDTTLNFAVDLPLQGFGPNAPQVREGELVAVNSFGTVYRLNPHVVDLKRLETEARADSPKLPTIGEARQFAREQSAEREQRREEFLERREAREMAEQKRWADYRDAKTERLEVAGMSSGKGIAGDVAGGTLKAGLLAVDVVSGVIDTLGAIVDGILSGKTEAPTRNQIEEIRARREAIAALARIHMSIEKGTNLSVDDVKQLPDTILTNIKNQGDDYLKKLLLNMGEERERDRGRSMEM